MSIQDELLQFNKRLKDVEVVNKNRMTDIMTLRQDVGLAFQSSKSKRRQINTYSSSNNASVYVGRETLWQKQNHFHQGPVQTTNIGNNLMDLQLPTLKDYLPHLNYFDNLKPALKIAASRTGVTLVFGIPTVKRTVKGYLVPTLQSLIDNMNEEEKDDSLIIVCIAEMIALFGAELEGGKKWLELLRVKGGSAPKLAGAPPCTYMIAVFLLRITLAPCFIVLYDV